MQIQPTARRVAAPATVLAAMLVVLTSVSAWAHPNWDPDEVPAGGAVEVELVIPHGCGVDGGEPEDGEEASPITEVALQITDEFGIRPQRIEGFDVLVEDDVAGWLALDGGSQTELVLPAVIEVSGDPGDVLPVPVYQECANGEFYRWGAGEDGDPAVNLTIVDGDPEPLPSESEVPTPGQNLPLVPSTAPTAAQTEEPTDQSTEEPTEATTEPTATETTSPTATETTPAPSATPTPTPSVTATPQAAAADGDDGGFNWALWLPVAVAIAIAVFAAVRYGKDEGDGDPTDDPNGGTAATSDGP